MRTPTQRSEQIYFWLIFFALSLSARALFIYLFPHCYSEDLRSWIKISTLLAQGVNPYNATHYLNWPPLWMQCIYGFKQISLATGLPFTLLVRIFLIAVESAMAVLLYATLSRFFRVEKVPWLVLLGIALSPISLFQVCEHCNFDILVGFWILLVVYMVLRFQEQHDPIFWLCACFALGMGALAKTVPLCLIPLLLISVRKLRPLEWALGAALVLVPIVLALSIIYVLGPAQVDLNVLRYRSCGGTFGFSGLFICWGAMGLFAAWPQVFVVIYGSAWLGLCLWLLFRVSLSNRGIVLLATALLLAIPTIGPGYGLQYICWFMPLLLLVYAMVSLQFQRFLLFFYLVATATYVFEYAFNFKFYGGFWLHLFPTNELIGQCAKLDDPPLMTKIHLPLWVLFLTLLGLLTREIKKEAVPRSAQT